MDDLELLRKYGENGSEEAFAILVRKYINLVYSSALRRVRIPDLAQEVTQVVFIILARKASQIGPATVLPGWLYRTTQYTAARAVRSEYRRKRNEQEVARMETNQNSKDTGDCWSEIAPILDQAIFSLREGDRNAILLRFFEQKNFKEVAALLGCNEVTARKRVGRALEKLRTLLLKRQVAVTAVMLLTLLSTKSVMAAPPGSIAATEAAVRGTGLAASTLALLKGTLDLLAWTKLKLTAAYMTAVLLLAGAGTLVLNEIISSGGMPAADSTKIPDTNQVVVVTFTNIAPFRWSMVESSDYRHYIEALKAINCPWETIKDIIIADVNALYARKLAALRTKKWQSAYWLSSDQRRKEDLLQRKQTDELQREKRLVLRDLLGIDALESLDAVWGLSDYWQAMMDFLPLGKRGEAAEIYIRYSDAAQAVLNKAQGFIDSQTQKEMKQLLDQEHAELAVKLSPDELAQFELRFSETSDHLRGNTPGFEPTESEFNAIFAARKLLTDQFGPYSGALDPEDKNAVAARDKLQKQLDAQLQSQLGPERFALYQRSQDQVFMTAQMFADQHDWPSDIASKIYDLKQQAFAQADPIRNDESIAASERQNLLNQIRANTEQAVAGVLPDQNANEYMKWSSWWFQNLALLPNK